MNIPAAILRTLRLWHKMSAGELLDRLQVSRATMMRAIKALGPEVVVRGKARRTAYAARRPVRGNNASIPLFRIDRAGCGSEIAVVDPLYPQGCAVRFLDAYEWPLIEAMRDGWFEGIPYPLDDMRPQGFLGRHFARQHAALLQVSESPVDWSEDDVLYALSVLGADQPGNTILGEAAYRRFLAEVEKGAHFLTDAETEAAYSMQALDALHLGVAGSAAGGEFPKFTEKRLIDGVQAHVIVKFSGTDISAGTQRWADLLVCEHLALSTVAEYLKVDAALSCIYQASGRTFLEVQRFDRHGAFGRSAVCSWAALNAALFGLGGKSWVAGAAALRKQGLIQDATEQDIQRIWYFGQLIANTDMHDGNLAFRPGLELAPVYDMLPMYYAPVRGVELPERQFAPRLPMPSEQAIWQQAAQAAIRFWHRAADDMRISPSFRQTCAENAEKVQLLVCSPVLTASSINIRP